MTPDKYYDAGRKDESTQYDIDVLVPADDSSDLRVMTTPGCCSPSSGPSTVPATSDHAGGG